LEIDNKKILETLNSVAARFGSPAKDTIIFENSGKHLFEINIILKNLNDNGKILDVGGGMGVNLLCIKELLNKNSGLYLIDRFEEYIEGNRMGSCDIGIKMMKESDISVTNQDFWNKSTFPFDSNSIDLITIIDVTEHLPGSPLKLFEEIKRILKPGGKLIYGGPNSVSISKRIRMLFGKHPYILLESWLDKNYYSHYREYSRKDSLYIFKKIGFKNIKTFMVAEPSKTQAHYHYFNDHKVRISLKMAILYILTVMEALFPPFRFAVYCIAEKP
jgi:SAM-dependent methyltransferase